MTTPRTCTLAAAAALLPLLALPEPATQDPQPPAAEAGAPHDGATIDSLLGAFYASISGAAGDERQWERFVGLFHPEQGRLSAVVERPHNSPVVVSYDPETYVERNAEFLDSRAMFESEVARRTEEFALLASCFSTFESRSELEDEEPFRRGIYAFQLWNDGERWWILSLVWQDESETFPLPEELERGD